MCAVIEPRDTIGPIGPGDTIRPIGLGDRDTIGLIELGDTIGLIKPGDTIGLIEPGDTIGLIGPGDTIGPIGSGDRDTDVVFLPHAEDEFGTPTIPDDFYLMTPLREFWVYSQYSGGYNQNNLGQENYSGNEEVPAWNPLLDVLVGSSSSFPRLFITGNATPDEIIRG
jgi:hypothetical protein